MDTTNHHVKELETINCELARYVDALVVLLHKDLLYTGAKHLHHNFFGVTTTLINN